MSLADARELLAYNDWANGRLLPAFRELPEGEWQAELGGSFASPQGTVAHLVAAEWIWLARWRGSSPPAMPEWTKGASAPVLLSRLQSVERERRIWLEGLTDGALLEEIEYRFLSGEPGRNRLAVLIAHLVNHSTYHRGQLVTMLRQLGRVPASTDLLVWDLEGRPA